MKRTAIASLLLLSGFAGSTVAQTPTYKAELLGTPEPDWGITAATAVNDSGQTVGFTYIAGYKRAWIAGPDQTLALLPIPNGTTFSEAFDINSAGVVAGGLYMSSGVSNGVLWRPGLTGYEVFIIPGLPGGEAPFNAQGINDAGDVVGKLGIFSNAYHWSETTEVLTQLPYTVFPVVPSDVNEQRQIVGNDNRLDLDTMVLETLGNPTGTTYGYMYTVLSSINDAGECGGYAVTATSGWPYLPVRYTDGPTWKVFSSFPLISAGVMGLAASGDTTFHLGIYGDYVHVEGFGSILLESTLDAAYAHFDLSSSFAPVISRGGLVACNGLDTSTGQSGVVLLTLLGFENLGGASRGALGDPVLDGYGTFIPGDATRLRLASATQNSLGVLVYSTASNPLPLFGGVLYANPPILLNSFVTDDLGRTELTFDWPSVSPGTAFYLQAGVFDSVAAGPVALSNALVGTTQ